MLIEVFWEYANHAGGSGFFNARMGCGPQNSALVSRCGQELREHTHGSEGCLSAVVESE